MKYSLLIHGPVQFQSLNTIYSRIKQARINFCKIVIVCYAIEYEKIRTICKELSFDNVEFVIIKDLLNPGFFNINRQIYSVNAGLKYVSENSYVFKLRIDQSINFNKLIKYISDDKIITTNCFTRSDRLYHPSDMFLCAPYQLIKDYYTIGFETMTSISAKVFNVVEMKNNLNNNYLIYTPESILFRNYINKKGWNILETYDDSLNALRKYFRLVNSWNVDFKWYKNSGNEPRINYTILPHYFNIMPYEGFPVEGAKCFDESDINLTKKSIKDLFYINYSKIAYKKFELKHNGYSCYKINIIILKKVIKNIFPRFYSYLKEIKKLILLM